MTHVDQITDLIRTHGLPPGGHLLRDVACPGVRRQFRERVAGALSRPPARYGHLPFLGIRRPRARDRPEQGGAAIELGARPRDHLTSDGAGHADTTSSRSKPGRSAALEHMLTWLDGGAPPPVQDRIRIEGDPPHIVRDEVRQCPRRHQDAGLRSAHRAPTGFAADGTLSLFGSTEPFDAQTLRRLYPDDDAYTAALSSSDHQSRRGWRTPAAARPNRLAPPTGRLAFRGRASREFQAERAMQDRVQLRPENIMEPS